MGSVLTDPYLVAVWKQQQKYFKGTDNESNVS